MNRTFFKILVVDQDQAIQNLIRRFFRIKKNYQVQCAQDGRTARVLFEQFNPDLVILDVNLPDALGYNLCQEMQSRTDVFVLFLTSRENAAYQDSGIKPGSDDYLTKPFTLRELENQVEAILRRREVTTELQFSLPYGQLVINLERREVTLNAEILPLTALEFDLIDFLARTPSGYDGLIDFLQKFLR